MDGIGKSTLAKQLLLQHSTGNRRPLLENKAPWTLLRGQTGVVCCAFDVNKWKQKTLFKGVIGNSLLEMVGDQEELVSKVIAECEGLPLPLQHAGLVICARNWRV
ncbi:hypothetical protein R1sor_005176 [Riccia sorocarpa]|uniref:NB-ARC domain-containing protein n=1 Tax=Riccia sorocarpa TaxID=122646 RepID=A0ABD3HML3_9MARC